MGKQSQLLLKPTEVELGLQVGVEFDNRKPGVKYNAGEYDVSLQGGERGAVV